jgi:hypothetical protein
LRRKAPWSRRNPFEWNSNELAVAGTVVGFAAIATTGPLALGLGVLAIGLGGAAPTKDVVSGADGFAVAMDLLGVVPGIGEVGRALRAGTLAEKSTYSFANIAKSSNWDFAADELAFTGTRLTVLDAYGHEQESEPEAKCR